MECFSISLISRYNNMSQFVITVLADGLVTLAAGTSADMVNTKLRCHIKYMNPAYAVLNYLSLDQDVRDSAVTSHEDWDVSNRRFLDCCV